VVGDGDDKDKAMAGGVDEKRGRRVPHDPCVKPDTATCEDWLKRPQWCLDLLQEFEAGRFTRPWYRILINAIGNHMQWDDAMRLLMTCIIIDRDTDHPELNRLLQWNPNGLLVKTSQGHASARIDLCLCAVPLPP
jgi:hypothetical protein